MDLQQFDNIKTPLDELFSHKLTENGDDALSTTGNNLLDILFMTEYYQNNLEDVKEKIGDSDIEKLFSMFIRDPRFGIGRRDLGRVLMKQAGVSPDDIVLAGRFDDLYADTQSCELVVPLEWVKYMWKEVLAGNELAKKWMPRFNTKHHLVANGFCKVLGVSEKEYRKAIKCNTVENKLSDHRIDEIDFEKVPSLAMIKYYNRFSKESGFADYLESVRSGEKKLNVSTTTVYDIYRNRDKIDADLFFDKLEKIPMNVCPILDTSGSMHDANDSIGKATSIAYYLAKCSTYANNQVVSFSSRPQLLNIHEIDYNYRYGNSNKFSRELNSIYTGDCSNTDFGAVIKLLKDLHSFPEYFVVLSDMEFDEGSSRSVREVFDLFDTLGVKSKIVWWNFNSRNSTVTVDKNEPRCIYLSGYNPTLLKYLESGFDGMKFLEKLLTEYAKNIGKDV